ncbi:MAG TPA: ATP-binding protein [Candidatus Krumholzibacteria bacterium]|jgi:anti-sigma regulatory factor (Ser/Thr protein kinase)
MIVLDAFDWGERRAFVRELHRPGPASALAIDSVLAILSAMGVEDVELVDAEPEGDLMEHRWSVYNDRLHYDFKYELRQKSSRPATDYLAVALATSGIEDQKALAQARLALHELFSNVLEHGIPRRADSAVRLQLTFNRDSLEGTLRDGCESFNPLLASPLPVRERLKLRARRGYGTEIARRLLDGIEYRELEDGNEIRYWKYFGEWAKR